MWNIIHLYIFVRKKNSINALYTYTCCIQYIKSTATYAIYHFKCQTHTHTYKLGGRHLHQMCDKETCKIYIRAFIRATKWHITNMVSNTSIGWTNRDVSTSIDLNATIYCSSKIFFCHIVQLVCVWPSNVSILGWCSLY